MIRIAVDAMGGDRAPQAIVSGAIDAVRRSEGRFEVILVGDTAAIQAAMSHHHFLKDLPLSILHAGQKIGMDESPVTALRKKPDASIAVAMRLQQQEKVDAVVSAGNTGAMLGASIFYLKPVQGVLRPSVGSFMPQESGVCFVIDVGSNVDCRPNHLLQFGMMGSIFVNDIMDIPEPTVGLLNIGEEETKGNEVSQAAYKLFKESTLNFIGNVEGRDVMRGKADVVVCDGFVGNILIKFGESMGRMTALTLKRKIGGNIAGTIGHFLMRPKFRKFLKLFDYREYGGAPILGVRGNCIVAHGSSGPWAIRNAIEEAWKLKLKRIDKRIEREIQKMKGV
jgi:glycerol-3-phosphate acyltransferase PlsX